MANQFKPIVRGPQVGSPPSLEFVAVDRLQVDQDYQRAIDGPQSRRIIVSMVREWDWSLCQPLVVSRRDDGSLWILDGQHRHAGARERGDIHHLPCTILPALARTGEARAFVALNTRRQKLSQRDIFIGLLASGDAEAKAVQGLLEETDWRVRRSDATDGFKPGDLVCAPMLVRQVKSIGPEVVRQALLVLRMAYPDDPITNSATMLEALISLLRPRGRLFGSSVERLADAMSAVPPGRWAIKAEALRHREPVLTRIFALAKVIADHFIAPGQPRTTSRLLDPPPPQGRAATRRRHRA